MLNRKRLTNQVFIERSAAVHSGLYDYSQTIYESRSKKVKIICKEHGVFEQIAGSHLSGKGCAKCTRGDNKSFITKAQAKHGNLYNYSVVDYTNNLTKISIICKDHGVFEQSPANHLKGVGCPKCGRIKTIKAQSTSTREFLLKARSHHGDKYAYDLSSWKNCKQRLDITCPTHGSFKQVAELHMNGRGCPKCGIVKGGLSSRLVDPDFVAKSNLIHKNKFDYSLVQYTTAKEKIKIICPIHGVFEQTAYAHLDGNGCKKCSNEARTKTNEDFIKESISVHGDRYDYTSVNYKHSQDKVNITCPTHGSFYQTPNLHLSVKCGCPICGNQATISKTEIEILDFIKSIGSIIVEQSNRTILSGKELDIYLPEHRLAIEYHGLYWHSTFGLKLRASVSKSMHQNKYLDCKSRGVTLIQIFEDEWVNEQKREIWKSIISNKLGKTENKVYARKCEIRSLTWKATKAFLDENHLMGSDSAPIRYGLFNDEELVAVLTFATPSLAGGDKNYDFNLSRFSIKKNTSVVGGFSKLLKHFQRLNPNTTLTTASDLRYSTGDVYLKNGFVLTHETKPNYWYWKSKNRHHRFNFRKQVLGKKLKNYDENLTERENMLNNGYSVIFDAGNSVFRFVN